MTGRGDERAILVAYRDLLVRLDKEVARAEAGTAAIGGLTKAGVLLESLLREVAAFLGLRVDSRKATIGDLAVVIVQQGRAPSGSTFVDDCIKELRKPRNRFDRMRALRNANAHDGGLPDLNAAKQTMQSLAGFLRSVGPRS